MLFILVMSTEITLLFSSVGGYKELVTLVPPPKGIKTTLCSYAKATKVSTSYSEAT